MRENMPLVCIRCLMGSEVEFTKLAFIVAETRICIIFLTG